MSRKHFLGILLFLLTTWVVQAQETERQYLSGTGLGSTVTWQFRVSEGRNSGRWSKIEVPSQWELQGFGEYTYGRWYKKPGVKTLRWKKAHTNVLSAYPATGRDRTYVSGLTV